MSRWNTVAIYGVGLIGGSIGMAVRERGLAKHVLGIGRNADRLAHAVELGAISKFTTNPAEVTDADVVVLCTPVRKLVEHCGQIAKQCPNALITDAGSTKEKLVATIARELPDARFVGSHPLAGSDRSGVANSSADLYDGRTVILTPTASTAADLVADTATFWESLGANTIQMDAAEHDRALAITSHLPHVVASALAMETPEELLSLIAGGWRDSTRIAAADVDMWTQIFQENNENVLAALRNLQSKLSEFETALSDNDQESITRLLTAGKQRRDALGS